MARFLIVEARFYDHLNDQLIAGARSALEADGHEVEVLTVPGALEIPGAKTSSARLIFLRVLFPFTSYLYVLL